MFETHDSDDFASFVQFVRAACGDDVLADFRPASAEAIARFVELVRWPLPPLYVSYLEHCGAGDGALKLADDADARVSSLTAFYEEDDPNDSNVPARGVVIGAYGLSGERTLVYPSDGAPSVAVSFWGELSHRCATRFSNFLYGQAYLRSWTKLDGTKVSRWRQEPALISQVRTRLEALGFVAYWFSDEVQISMERDDGTRVHASTTGERTSLWANGSERAAAELETALASTLDRAMRPSQ